MFHLYMFGLYLLFIRRGFAKYLIVGTPAKCFLYFTCNASELGIHSYHCVLPVYLHPALEKGEDKENVVPNHFVMCISLLLL